ncbi:long-chain-fatty-acid---luciferin-component ligase [Anaerobacterium chartisolvens]|uniref:Long-chain-fatty-acid---luciferin-component ligase n=1 Tax=Anaerobacterium chartisolvens TaxID=1297424 RepID=A0A369B7D5_9FIRM|nr:LuxE family acyl-protein synthetase [Anaerobacterium chartisolvens]RCX16518.1 long-chain-fatty-acid---luciferin-component ligase [Anaerobacterium chartisolvens]
MYEILGKLAISPYLFHCEKGEQDKIKFEVIQKSFHYHYEKNDYYRSLCEVSGISPEDIQGIGDFHKIPLIPIRSFKQQEQETQYLLSVPLKTIEHELRSSGTSGTPSVARRDYDTYTIAQMLYIGTYREFLFRDFPTGGKSAGVYLVPSPAEVPDMGMIKGFTLLNFALHTCGYAVENMKLNCEKAVKFLQQWEGKFTRFLLSPPFMLSSFVDYLAQNDIRIKLDKHSKIVTVGGWKHHTGAMIPREELDRKCEEYLGVNKSQIRDFYGLAESNLMAFECENNNKHIPPTVHVSIRDMGNPASEAEDGKEGLIAILDPISTSYPGFILTEDLATLKRDCECSCGRTSDVMSKIGRAPKSDLRNCALSLEKFMAEKDKRKSIWLDEKI